MSLTSALNSAFSGLTAAGRSSSLVSSNIANALTDGYARRDLALGSDTTNGGVRILGTLRHVDLAVLSNRREAEAGLRQAETLSGFFSSYEAVLGQPGEATSLTGRLADFEARLVSAASRPDATSRLDAVASSGRDLASQLNAASREIESQRSAADRAIGTQVETLNKKLETIQKLNTRITAIEASGKDTTALQDQRQALIDDVNEIVPVRRVQRDFGQVALYSTGGAILLDGSPATIEFTPSNTVTADMRVETGRLSGLSINGIELGTDSASSPLRGGTLLAQFEIRDEAGVAAQADLDAFARDLIERFQSPGVDPTLGPTDAGLFTDAGDAFDPANEVGLAGRLSLNALADPNAGGESWRIRDGLGATAPGSVGDATMLRTLKDALTSTRPTPTGQKSAADHGSDLLSKVARGRSERDEAVSYASSTYSQMREIELADGVDTDTEMQRLLLIEQAYAANARVIETVDEMMNTLLRI